MFWLIVGVWCVVIVVLGWYCFFVLWFLWLCCCGGLGCVVLGVLLVVRWLLVWCLRYVMFVWLFLVGICWVFGLFWMIGCGFYGNWYCLVGVCFCLYCCVWFWMFGVWYSFDIWCWFWFVFWFVWVVLDCLLVVLWGCICCFLVCICCCSLYLGGVVVWWGCICDWLFCWVMWLFFLLVVFLVWFRLILGVWFYVK